MKRNARRSSNLLILLLISYASLAQQVVLSERDYVLKYKKAVQLYADQKYFEAKDELTPLTNRRYENSMVPFVLYYHALSSFKLLRHVEARSSLRQLFERFPDWKRIDEAYYLYANACFVETYIDEAMQYVNRISTSTLRQDIENMQYYYFSKYKDPAQLKQFNQKYPNSVVIAQLLVDNIQKNRFTSREDLELSDRLTNQFNLGESSILSNSGKKNTPIAEKPLGAINVAILLPFRLFEFDASKSTRANQYIYDMYAGMKLAKQKLELEQINVNLFTFDVEREANLVTELVSNSSFSEVDLFVGPLYPEANKVLNTFAKSNEIVQVHPLSNNRTLIVNDKNTFLASPSYEMQAAKAIDYISSQNTPKSVAIYYGNTRKDSTFAYIYRQKAIEAGMSISVIKKFLVTEDIDFRKPGHIFISGSENTFGSKVINALDKKKINSPIVAASSAFDFEASSLNVFNRQLYLIQLDYVNREKEEVKNFRSSYINEQNIAPSYYGYWGYDMLLFYGRMLNSGKSKFRNNLDAIEYTQGYVLDGFDFTNGSNENKIVPIIKYQDGKFIEVSR